MSTDRVNSSATDWRQELPVLATYNITLREPTADDLAAIIGVLSGADATRFGIDDVPDENAVRRLIEHAASDRAAGASFTYVVTTIAGTVGLVQVRQLSPGFQAAEWEMTLTPSARGAGIFLETARLVGSFVFDTLGAHRIEARVLQHNGRAMGALRKIGAVQEGLLRRSTRRGGEYVDQVLWSILKEDWGDPQPSVPQRVH